MSDKNPVVRVHHDGLDADAKLPRQAIQHFDGWHEVNADGEPVKHVDAGELKGEDLDAALDERGLSKTGTADEKRARVAEHDADQSVLD